MSVEELFAFIPLASLQLKRSPEIHGGLPGNRKGG